MKRILTILILAITSTSAFAQYNTNYVQSREEISYRNYLRNKEAVHSFVQVNKEATSNQSEEINLEEINTNSLLEEMSNPNYLIYIKEKGKRQIATGGIVLSSTLAFDLIYFCSLGEASKKAQPSDYKIIKDTYITGYVLTGVGILASIIQFAAGYHNIKISSDRIYVNETGSICVRIPERREVERHKPVPSWKK